MTKLISKTKADKYFPYQERWILDNGLELHAFFEESGVNMTIDSPSGNVGNQIYEVIREIKDFSNARLVARMGYVVVVDEKLFPLFLEQVEKIDVTKLKEGEKF